MYLMVRRTLKDSGTFSVFWLLQQGSNSLFLKAITLHGIFGGDCRHPCLSQELHAATVQPPLRQQITFPLQQGFHATPVKITFQCKMRIATILALSWGVSMQPLCKSNSTWNCMQSSSEPHASPLCKGLCTTSGKPHSREAVCNSMQASFTQGFVCNLPSSPLW